MFEIYNNLSSMINININSNILDYNEYRDLIKKLIYYKK